MNGGCRHLGAGLGVTMSLDSANVMSGAWVDGTPFPLYVASLDGPSMWAPKQDGRFPFLVTQGFPQSAEPKPPDLLMLRPGTGPASLLLLSADSEGSQVSPHVCRGHRWGPHKGTNSREAWFIGATTGAEGTSWEWAGWRERLLSTGAS